MKKTLQKDTTVPSEDKLLSKLDIKAGKFTYNQRIELGKIFEAKSGDFETFFKVFECLHGFTPDIKPKTEAEIDKLKHLVNYYNEIVEGLQYWINAENTLLKCEPSPEEISAGVKQLTQKIGEYGTIKALAKNYSKDPDEILGWEYGKVFGILYTDLEEHKYQKRYYKVLERRYKK